MIQSVSRRLLYVHNVPDYLLPSAPVNHFAWLATLEHDIL